MNINTSISDETVASLFEFGREMTSASGVRAVAAWIASSDPEVVYDLNSYEAPYELRDVIADDIGSDAANEGLIGGHDIPRYLDYLNLHYHYGDEWPVPALTEYFGRFRQMSREDAERAAQAIWQPSMERYEALRKTTSMSTTDETVQRKPGVYEFARYQLSAVAFDLSPTDEGSPERVVSAWKLLPTTDLSEEYGPEGWALFDVVRSDLGETVALRDFNEEELECHAEYAWFNAFVELANAYGEDWPKAALADYLRGFEGMAELEARTVAALAWEKAKHLYDARKSADKEPAEKPEKKAA